MNDRIKKLAEEALKDSMVHDGVYRPEGYAIGVSKAFANKFAELIVRECAELVDDGYGSTNFGNGICGAQVLKHFGVERLNPNLDKRNAT